MNSSTIANLELFTQLFEATTLPLKYSKAFMQKPNKMDRFTGEVVQQGVWFQPGDEARKGTILYDMQNDFAYQLHEYANSPSVLQQQQGDAIKKFIGVAAKRIANYLSKREPVRA